MLILTWLLLNHFWFCENKIELDKKVCEQTLSWLAKAGPESFKKFEKFYKFKF